MVGRISDDNWLISKPIAHRGLHGNGVAENSRTSFINAIEKGYPIETDLQCTADGVLVCVHDDNLKRVTGEDLCVWDLTLEEVRKLRLLNTEDGIMTFKEMLDLVNGQVPLLIEIKIQHNKEVAKMTIDGLKGYTGEYAIQSFDPTVMLKIKKLAPDVIRGQLASRHKIPQLDFLKNFVLTKMPLNFLVKPDFINMDYLTLPLKPRERKKYKTLCWTIRDIEALKIAEQFADGFVFENVFN